MCMVGTCYGVEVHGCCMVWYRLRFMVDAWFGTGVGA
jgi:hypothetical protein